MRRSKRLFRWARKANRAPVRPLGGPEPPEKDIGAGAKPQRQARSPSKLPKRWKGQLSRAMVHEPCSRSARWLHPLAFKRVPSADARRGYSEPLACRSGPNTALPRPLHIHRSGETPRTQTLHDRKSHGSPPIPDPYPRSCRGRPKAQSSAMRWPARVRSYSRQPLLRKRLRLSSAPEPQGRRAARSRCPVFGHGVSRLRFPKFDREALRIDVEAFDLA
jgi:hypothetical protein